MVLCLCICMHVCSYAYVFVCCCVRVRACIANNVQAILQNKQGLLKADTMAFKETWSLRFRCVHWHGRMSYVLSRMEYAKCQTS